MQYKLVYFESFPDGAWSVQRTDQDGTVWSIPLNESNSDYMQYLADTDGGLPIPDSEPKV